MRDYKKEELYPNSKTLSSSQFLDYVADPKRFFLDWFLGVEREASDAMKIGLCFSEMFADRSFDYKSYLLENGISPIIIRRLEEAIERFPELPKDSCEKEIYAEHNGWRFRATLDGYIESKNVIIENKTGKAQRDRTEFVTSPQIDFQAWAVWKKTGELPNKIICNWVDLNAHPEDRVHSWTVNRSLQQVKTFEKLVNVVIDNLEAENFYEPILI